MRILSNIVVLILVGFMALYLPDTQVPFLAAIFWILTVMILRHWAYPDNKKNEEIR